MSPILDTFPYPWHEPSAQKLHVALMQIYPSSSGALFAAQKAGIDRGYIFAEQMPAMVWKDILDQAANAKLTRALVNSVRDANPRSPWAPFLDALLAQTPASPYAGPVPTDAEPLGALGAPHFIAGTDDVTEPEALLFHDDLTIPIGLVPWLIDALRRLHELAPAVCRVRATTPGGVNLGTGFRVGPGLLLTNHHVLHDKMGAPATSVSVEFGFEEDASGNGLPTRVITCDVSTIAANQPDDWAVIQAAEALDAAWPIIPLSQAAVPAVGKPAFVIHHPGGDRKRLSFVRNQITKVGDAVVHYLSDTRTGSSGSPVLDAEGRLLALHHAGGRPQEVAGKQPVIKNEGIRIPRILAGLQAAQITIP
jgi:V8-like Glu-specific endopeptidase